MSAAPERFDLFVSYVRVDSRRQLDIVPTLKRALESHTHPDDARRRFRVCTDVDDLELDGTVSNAIRNKILASSQLLVLCTSGARGRPYVIEEIDTFRATHAEQPLGAFIDLEPHEAFPNVFPEGTIGADLHPRGSVREFREQIERESHKIVAEVWDVPLPRVYDRFVAERRRLQRRVAIGIAAAVIAIVAAIIVTAGEWGLHSVHELPMKRKIVAPASAGWLDDGRVAVVDNLAVHVWHLDDSRTEKRPSPAHPLAAHVLGDDRVLVLDLDRLAVVDRTGIARTIDVGSTGPFEGMAVMGNDIAVVSKDGDLFFGRIDGSWQRAPRPVTTILRWAPAFSERGPLRYGEDLMWSRDGKWLASATGTGQLIILQPRSQRFLRGADPIVYETANTAPIGGLLFLEKPERLLFAEGSSGLRSVNLTTGRVDPLALPPLPLVRDLRHARTRNIVIGTTTETLEVFALENGSLRWKERIPLSPKSTPRAALSPDERTLLVAYFDAPPDLFRWTWRVFGVDVWGR